MPYLLFDVADVAFGIVDLAAEPITLQEVLFETRFAYSLIAAATAAGLETSSEGAVIVEATGITD